MITTNFDYASCVRASEKVAWKLDEVFPADLRLDFTRPFLPESLALGGELPFLSPGEALKLNQIAGNAYLYLFSFVEEYIIASTVEHAHAEMFGDEMAMRALLRFAEEEIKHQQLFRRFRVAFERDFGTECGVIPDPQSVAEVILGKAPMAVLLITLHLELVTQQHFVEGYRNGESTLDPFFASLLKCHWLEEAQHAKIDALELAKLAEGAPAEKIAEAITDYVSILENLAALLAQQGALDAESLARATLRTFTASERSAIERAQTRAYRRMLITLAVENPAFDKYLVQFSEAGRAQVVARLPELS